MQCFDKCFTEWFKTLTGVSCRGRLLAMMSLKSTLGHEPASFANFSSSFKTFDFKYLCVALRKHLKLTFYWLVVYFPPRENTPIVGVARARIKTIFTFFSLRNRQIVSCYP